MVEASGSGPGGASSWGGEALGVRLWKRARRMEDLPDLAKAVSTARGPPAAPYLGIPVTSSRMSCRPWDGGVGPTACGSGPAGIATGSSPVAEASNRAILFQGCLARPFFRRNKRGPPPMDDPEIHLSSRIRADPSPPGTGPGPLDENVPKAGPHPNTAHPHAVGRKPQVPHKVPPHMRRINMRYRPARPAPGAHGGVAG